jgi:hypothetical protein
MTVAERYGLLRALWWTARAIVHAVRDELDPTKFRMKRTIATNFYRLKHKLDDQ